MNEQCTFPIDDSAPQTVLDELHNDLVRSHLFLLRNVCDMIVYFQWIESYRPYKTLEYICGIISGGLGVYLVWADVGAPPSVTKKEV